MNPPHKFYLHKHCKLNSLSFSKAARRTASWPSLKASSCKISLCKKKFEKKMKEEGIRVIKTNVGDKYVVEEMRKNNPNNNNKHITVVDRL